MEVTNPSLHGKPHNRLHRLADDMIEGIRDNELRNASDMGVIVLVDTLSKTDQLAATSFGTTDRMVIIRMLYATIQGMTQA